MDLLALLVAGLTGWLCHYSWWWLLLIPLVFLFMIISAFFNRETWRQTWDLEQERKKNEKV